MYTLEKKVKEIKKLQTITLMMALSFSASSALAADGTIHFTGTVSSSACTVSDVNNSASTAGTVDFGQMSSKTFSTIGGITKSVPFSIALTDCSAGSAPKITFSGSGAAAQGYESLFATNVTGLGIKIVDADALNTLYAPNISTGNVGLNAITSNSVNNTKANFLGYIQSYTAGAHSGSIDTTINFVIDYSKS